MASPKPFHSQKLVEECAKNEVQHFFNSSDGSRKETADISSHDSISTAGSQGRSSEYPPTTASHSRGDGYSDDIFQDYITGARHLSSSFADLPFRLPHLESPSQAMDSTSLPHSLNADERSSEVAFDPHEKRWNTFRKNLRDVCDMRNTVLENRISARHRRDCLRRCRDYMASSGAELMMNLSVLFAQTQQNDDIKPVLDLFERFQRARDTYQAIEDDYDEFEIDYIAGEYQLEKTEKKLQYRSQEFWNNDSTHQSNSGTSSSLKASHVPYQPNIALHDPLTFSCLSTTKDAELLQGYLADIHIEEYLLLEEQAKRERLGLSLGEESQSFLKNFDQYQHRVQNQLSIVKGDARNKKGDCLEEGLLDWEDTLSLYSDSISQQGAVGLPTVPLLLLWDEERPLFFESSLRPQHRMGRLAQGIDGPHLLASDVLQLQRTLDTTARINKWLLHKLCASTLDIHLLRDMSGLESLHIDEESFRDLVLDWWDKDGAAIKPVTRPHSPGDSLDLELYHLVGGDVEHSHFATSTSSRRSPSALSYAPVSLPSSADQLGQFQFSSGIDRPPDAPKSFTSETRPKKQFAKSAERDGSKIDDLDFDRLTV